MREREMGASVALVMSSPPKRRLAGASGARFAAAILLHLSHLFRGPLSGSAVSTQGLIGSFTFWPMFRGKFGRRILARWPGRRSGQAASRAWRSRSSWRSVLTFAGALGGSRQSSQLERWSWLGMVLR